MPKKKVEINPECGRRLKSLLQKRGIKQCNFADELHIDPKHLSAIISGKRRLTPDNAQAIADMLPPVRSEWLLCKDDYETEKEKEYATEKKRKEEYKAVEFYDKAFRCFVEGLEDLRGYGISTNEESFLCGECVTVTDANKRRVGILPISAYQQFQAEVEHYASYLIRNLIKNEMLPLPEDGEKGVEGWQIFKNAVIEKEN